MNNVQITIRPIENGFLVGVYGTDCYVEKSYYCATAEEAALAVQKGLSVLDQTKQPDTAVAGSSEGVVA